jgi:hypothetical protein
MARIKRGGGSGVQLSNAILESYPGGAAIERAGERRKKLAVEQLRRKLLDEGMEDDGELGTLQIDDDDDQADVDQVDGLPSFDDLEDEAFEEKLRNGKIPAGMSFAELHEKCERRRKRNASLALTPQTREQRDAQAAAARAEQVRQARGGDTTSAERAQGVVNEFFDNRAGMGAAAVDRYNRGQRSGVMRSKADRIIRKLQADVNIPKGATWGWWAQEIRRQDPGICTPEQQGELNAIVQDLLDYHDIIKKTTTQSASMSVEVGEAMSSERCDSIVKQVMTAPPLR